MAQTVLYHATARAVAHPHSFLQTPSPPRHFAMVQTVALTPSFRLLVRFLATAHLVAYHATVRTVTLAVHLPLSFLQTLKLLLYHAMAQTAVPPLFQKQPVSLPGQLPQAPQPYPMALPQHLLCPLLA